jgi:hypothetical protein
VAFLYSPITSIRQHCWWWGGIGCCCFFIFDAHFVGGFFATSAELAQSKITPRASGGIDAGCVLLGAAKLSLGERLEMELVAAWIRGDKKLPMHDDAVGDLDTLPALGNRVGWHQSSPGSSASIGCVIFVRTGELLQMQARIWPPSWGAAAGGGGVFGCVFVVFSL